MLLIKENWKYFAGLALVLALLFWVRGEYQEWKQQQKSVPQIQTVAAPTQVIHTNTETIREVAVQASSQPGAVLQFVERDGKVIAVVNGQEVEVPNQTGQPSVKLGENGELRMTSTTTAKIDVTEMANVQARLIANQELAEQKKSTDAKMKKEKDVRIESASCGLWELPVVLIY